jgi:hypothetical protein
MPRSNNICNAGFSGNNHAANPTLISDAGFDHERDLAPVTIAPEANKLLVVHPSAGACIKSDSDEWASVPRNAKVKKP